MNLKSPFGVPGKQTYAIIDILRNMYDIDVYAHVHVYVMYMYKCIYIYM